MGISLQHEMEPLLTKLGQVAETAFEDREPYGESPDVLRQNLKIFNNDLSSLMTRFRGYYSLDGHNLDALADRFAEHSDQWQTPTGNSVYCAIARAADGIDEVEKLIHLGEWNGTGADSFYHNFLSPFKDTAVTHVACAVELAIGAKALGEGVERTKECVVWICKDLISLLGGDSDPGPLPGAEKESGYKEDAGFAAILADTVALLKALLAPEVEVFDASLAALGVGGGLIAESKSSGHGNSLHINPGDYSALSLVRNTWLTLDRLDKNIGALDEKIDQGLETDLGKSGPFGSPSARMKSKSPVQPSAYGQLNDTGHNVQVVVDVVQLYYAGYSILPVAAGWYDFGTKICAAAHIDGVQKQFPRAVGKYNETVPTFGGLLATVRDDITASAGAMVKAATTYRDADQNEAGRIKTLESQIPSPGNFSGVEHYTPPEWLQP
ncbi:hypothetical protein [Nocardia alni]|uniref:hypothetical protein n=1 Tax=Nocardia alni TaxID=2815723 RepID=UPI001C239A68|nr:hypothetical protein [Nocardia alni]